MLEKLDQFSFNHSDQIDRLYEVMTTTQMKQLFDSRGEELRTALNKLINDLETEVGASNIGMTPITALGSHSTVKDIINRIIEILKSTTDDISGADFISATPIDGLEGVTVQALLESLKKFIDDYKTELNSNNGASKVKTSNGKTVQQELDGKVNQGGNFTGSWHGITSPEYAEPGIAAVVAQHTSQLADIMTVNIKKYIDIDALDDSQSFQQAINDILVKGGGKIVIPRLSREYNIESSILIQAAGDVNIYIEGVGNPVINTKSNITVFDFKSSSIPSTGYASRIQWVGIENITLKADNGLTGIGINVKSFGFLHMKDVQILGFDKNYNLEDGSEAILQNIRGAGGNYGFVAKRTNDSSDSDVASVVMIECNFHNNNIASIQIDGVRQIAFYGGSLIASNASLGAVEIRATQKTVDYVNFHGCNFENTAKNNQVIIGNGSDAGTIALVNIESCQLAIPQKNKIVVNKCEKLNVKNCSVDTNHTPTIIINNTVSSSFDLSIENNYPYWIQYNVLDNRSAVVKTILNLSEMQCINNKNFDFTKGTAGYISNTQFLLDKINFVTGANSVCFSANGSEKYLEYDLYKNGEIYRAPYGTIFDIEIISKFSSVASILYAYLRNSDGTDLVVTLIPQFLKIQTFDNGFERRFTRFIVPNGKACSGFKISNNADKNTNLYIDMFKIYANEQLDTDLYLKSAPISGTWTQGNIIKLLDPIASGYAYKICTVSGEPGIWKGQGLIES